MTSEVKWYLEDQILTIQHTGIFNMEDAEYLIGECVTHLNNATHQIHVIVNHSATESLSSDLHRVTKIKELALPFFGHENLGIIIAYGIENRLIRFFATMAGQLSKHEYHLVDTFEEAIRLIKHNDAVIAERLESS